MSTVTLRPWQRAAFELFRANPEPDFLAVATPGAGKTAFALTCARAQLADWAREGPARRLVVVAPTSHLKSQWSLSAHRLGLQLDPDWAPGQGLARDTHGLVTTYQQIATGPAADTLRGLVADGMVILDEVHHAADERAWGDGILRAFELAARRLSLSGTPFRSDSSRIPFVRYDATAEGDLAHPDYTYGYADALRDGGVVRPVYFPRVPDFDAEPDPPDPVFDDDPALALDLPDVPTEAGLVPWGSLSVAEQKDDLRTRNADVAKRLVDMTGWNHARVQAEMNRLAGVTSVTSATVDQLERRLRYAESWLRRARRG